MTEISYADASLTDSLKELWHEAFGDDYNYIDFFFKNHTDTRCIVMREGNRALSAVHLIDASISGQPVLYAYAVATLKDFRGHGFSRILLERASEDFAIPLILRPASGGLRQYYHRCGFSDAFISQSELLDKDEFGLLSSGLRQTDADEYAGLRAAFFEKQKIPYVKWGLKGIRYAVAENKLCGGGALTDGTGIILYRPLGDKICVIENTISYNPRLEGFGMIKCGSDVSEYAGAYMNLVLE